MRVVTAPIWGGATQLDRLFGAKAHWRRTDATTVTTVSQVPSNASTLAVGSLQKAPTARFPAKESTIGSKNLKKSKNKKNFSAQRPKQKGSESSIEWLPSQQKKEHELFGST
jgi:hypothetical protein